MRYVIYEGQEHSLARSYHLDGVDPGFDAIHCSLTVWVTLEGMAYLEINVWQLSPVKEFTPQGAAEVSMMFNSLRNAIALGAEIIRKAYPGATIMSDARGAREAMAESFGLGGPR